MNVKVVSDIKVLGVLLLALIMTGCKDQLVNVNQLAQVPEIEADRPSKENILSQNFKNYWYAGEAEITSYKLEQARYGEIRDGKAVLIFVTEDFLPEVQVKANNYNTANIPILKLNATKRFNTGIYPYSIMQSTFFPVSNKKHALKISASVQEWCGQVYAQLNNRNDFEIMSHSYFQGEADTSYNIDKTWTENELWTKLRINPKSLPTGNISMIPSLEYTRLKHKSITAYDAYAQLEDSLYSLTYPDLNRTFKFKFNTEFPYDILGWEETVVSGYGANAEILTTKATKLESVKSAYWQKNSKADEFLRARLKL